MPYSYTTTLPDVPDSPAAADAMLKIINAEPRFHRALLDEQDPGHATANAFYSDLTAKALLHRPTEGPTDA